MPFNQNAGYGRFIATALAAAKPHTGKEYFVTASTDPNWEELTEMFPTGPEGNTRVWSSLSSLLSSGLISDGGDDVVFVAPNYTETVTTAGGLAVGTTSAGLTIVGLGSGDERPLINFTTATTADFDIGSNGVTIENFRFDLTGVDALAGPIDVNDSGCTFRNCEFITADADGQATVGVVTDANASYLTIENCSFYGSENAGTKSAIRLVGGNNAVIRNNHFEGNYKITAGAIEATTTAPGMLLIQGNTIVNRTASSTRAVNLVAGTRATIENNRFHVRSNTTPVSVGETGSSTAVGFVVTSGNYFTNATAIGAGVLL